CYFILNHPADEMASGTIFCRMFILYRSIMSSLYIKWIHTTLAESTIYVYRTLFFLVTDGDKNTQSAERVIKDESKNGSEQISLSLSASLTSKTNLMVSPTLALITPVEGLNELILYLANVLNLNGVALYSLKKGGCGNNDH